MGCHHRIKYFEELVQALIQGQGNTYVEYNPPHVPGPDKFPKRLVFLGEGGLGLLLGSLFLFGGLGVWGGDLRGFLGSHSCFLSCPAVSAVFYMLYYRRKD